ncbi:MAG: archease [Methanoregula sp.]
MSFEEISHTADVKIRARALTLDALFTDAFLALMQIVYGTDKKVGIVKEIQIESDTIESLLIDFLSEVLFIAEVEGLVFSEADIIINGLNLTAILKGELFDPRRHSSGTEVKGISYSGLIIQKDANGYMLDILFDV